MPTLLPFRQYDEFDVINLFAYSGTHPVNRGTFVKPVASGWRTDETDTEFLGSPGAAFANTVSLRYGTIPRVTAAGTGDNVIGMLLYDVKETDENGEKLIYKPRKAAEMQVALSGQTVPLATAGMFLWSGTINGTVSAGAGLYPSGVGELTVNPINQVKSVGYTLGMANGLGHTLIQLNVASIKVN